MAGGTIFIGRGTCPFDIWKELLGSWWVSLGGDALWGPLPTGVFLAVSVLLGSVFNLPLFLLRDGAHFLSFLLACRVAGYGRTWSAYDTPFACCWRSLLMEIGHPYYRFCSRLTCMFYRAESSRMHRMIDMGR